MICQLKNQNNGLYHIGRYGLRLSSSVGVIFFLILAISAEELVTPLIVPKNNSSQENTEDARKQDPILGFTLLPIEPKATPLVGEGSSVLPGGSNAAPMDVLVDPLTRIDPNTDLPLTLPDDPFSDENIAATNLGSLPVLNNHEPLFGFTREPRWLNGFSNSPNNAPIGRDLLEALLEGFSFSTALTNIYDTNPSQGYSTAANSGEGDFSTNIGGSISYRSIDADWTYAASYTGNYTQYFNQTDLNGYNQSAAGLVNYEGGSFNVGLTLGINFESGANRIYESVVNEMSYYYGLDARYRISEKTSLRGSLSQTLNAESSGPNANSLEVEVSALWAYSQLTEFGPGIRYTHRSGDSQQDRSSLGPTFAINYQLAQKVSLKSAIGMDFVSYDDGSSPESSLFTSIGLNYRASTLWWMSLSLMRDVEASYSTAGEFEETTSLRIGYNRSIRRAIWTLGMGLENRVSNNPSPLVPVQPDRNYLTFDTGLSMPIFAGTTNANVFMRYSDQSTGGANSWDSFQIGFGLKRFF